VKGKWFLKSFLNILKIISLVEKWTSCKEQWTATTIKSLLVSNPTHLADRGFFWPIACLGASQLLAWHVWHISFCKNKTNRTKANNRKNNCQSIHHFKFCGAQDVREEGRDIEKFQVPCTRQLFCSVFTGACDLCQKPFGMTSFHDNNSYTVLYMKVNMK